MSIEGISQIRKCEIRDAYREAERRHGKDAAVGLIGFGYTLSPEDIEAILKEENDGREPGNDKSDTEGADQENPEGQAPSAPTAR